MRGLGRGGGAPQQMGIWMMGVHGVLMTCGTQGAWQGLGFGHGGTILQLLNVRGMSQPVAHPAPL